LNGHVENFKVQADLQKKEVEESMRNAELAMRALSRFKTPYSQLSELPAPYFWNLLKEFENRMQHCRRVIGDIERFIESKATEQQFSPQGTL